MKTDDNAFEVLVDFRIDSGGVGRYSRDLIAALQALDPGPELSIVSRGGPWTAPFTPWGRLYTFHQLGRSRFHLLHALHVEVPPRRGVPIVVTMPDLIPLEFLASMPNLAKRFVYRRIVQTALRRADLVIVPSGSTRRALERIGADVSRVREVPWGVGTLFRPSTSVERENARDRYAHGSSYVAAIADRRPHKNAHLLHGVARLLREHADLRVVCIGAPIPGVDGVIFSGPLSDVDLRELYGGAEVFILPSMMEGFGYPALESLACGVPVVCGAGVGALDHIAGGCSIVDVGDVEAVTDAVSSIVNDDASRTSLSERGLAIAQELTTERMARRTLDVYVEAVG